MKIRNRIEKALCLDGRGERQSQQGAEGWDDHLFAHSFFVVGCLPVFRMPLGERANPGHRAKTRSASPSPCGWQGILSTADCNRTIEDNRIKTLRISPDLPFKKNLTNE